PVALPSALDEAEVKRRTRQGNAIRIRKTEAAEPNRVRASDEEALFSSVPYSMLRSPGGWQTASYREDITRPEKATANCTCLGTDRAPQLFLLSVVEEEEQVLNVLLLLFFALEKRKTQMPDYWAPRIR